MKIVRISFTTCCIDSEIDCIKFLRCYDINYIATTDGVLCTFAVDCNTLTTFQLDRLKNYIIRSDVEQVEIE